MPVTFSVAPHDASPVNPSYKPQEKSAAGVLRTTAQDASSGFQELLQTSIADADVRDIVPSRNGFVYGCLEAYNRHHNLVIRPDDVWIAVMSQFASYVENNSEKMKEYFVGDQEGKKKLTVTGSGDRYSADFGSMARQMAELLEANIKDKQLKGWIIPGFSTTTKTDEVVGAVLLMSSMKNFFSYGFQLMCGIPSVTLDGTKQDWEEIRSRLSKLRTFGDEAQHPYLHAWHKLLHPLLTNFIDAFDVFSPTSPPSARAQEIKDFFQRICCIQGGGSGPRYLSGWLTFFCAFDSRGNWQLTPVKEYQDHWAPLSAADAIIFGASHGEVAYVPKIDRNDIPAGYAEVEVELDDNGAVFHTTMVAGFVGHKILGVKRDTVQPVTGFWYFTRDKAAAMKGSW